MGPPKLPGDFSGIQNQDNKNPLDLVDAVRTEIDLEFPNLELTRIWNFEPRTVELTKILVGKPKLNINFLRI